MTKTNGKATEIVSVHSNWWSELPRAYHEELHGVSYKIVFFYDNFARACNKDQAAASTCMYVRS